MLKLKTEGHITKTGDQGQKTLDITEKQHGWPSLARVDSLLMLTTSRYY